VAAHVRLQGVLLEVAGSAARRVVLELRSSLPFGDEECLRARD